MASAGGPPTAATADGIESDKMTINGLGIIHKASSLTTATSIVEILHNHADANASTVEIEAMKRPGPVDHDGARGAGVLWYRHKDTGSGIPAKEFTKSMRELFRSDRTNDDRMGCFGEGQKMALIRLAAEGGTSIIVSTASPDDEV